MNTLNGRIGKAGATRSQSCSADSRQRRLLRFILCTRRSGDTAHAGGGCDQSIGSTVSDAIARSW